MDNRFDFYRTPGPYTDVREFRALLQTLPDDVESLIRFGKALLIHPIAARECGVRFNYKNAVRNQADHRSVNDILRNPKVSALLARGTLDLHTEPAERGILSCDHHAILHVAILRLKGKAARARCGYATYLVPDRLTPHWIVEVHDETAGTWQSVDPEQGRVQIPNGEFLTAGDVWRRLKDGSIAIGQVLPDYQEGLDGAKYRLLNDINALMKNEQLNYDWLIREAAPKKPAIFALPVEKLTQTDLDLLDQLATFSGQTEGKLDEIRRLYTGYLAAENLPG